MRGGCVLVDRRRVGDRRGRFVAVDGADRAQDACRLAVGLAHFARRVGVPNERRSDGHAQPAVDEIGRADQDGGVEVVAASRRGVKRAATPE